MHPMHMAIRFGAFKSLHQSERPVQEMERVNSMVHRMLWRVLPDKQRRMQSVFLKLVHSRILIGFLLLLWFYLGMLTKYVVKC
jgi:hypothetical protein